METSISQQALAVTSEWNTQPKGNGIIVLNSAAYGGISDYLHFQANALIDHGFSVTMVGNADGSAKDGARYAFVPLWRQPKKSTVRLIQQARFVLNLISNMRRFAAFLKQRPERFVLFGAFLEYFAPLWAGQFRRLVHRGWRFATVIHDPVRDYIVGPEWWHRRSIRAGYSFVSAGFVHGHIQEVQDATGVELVTVPFGQYPFPPASKTKDQVRQSFGIPLKATVVLTFGHLRDGKNLDLLIRGIADLPDIHLIIAGKEQSGGQKPASYYQAIAKELGISNRCHFQIRYIHDSEIGNFFAATDVNALTYSRDFRSASAALAAATHYRKVSLASSGEGPLKHVIQEYNLGVWVEPDCVDSIRNGLTTLMEAPVCCDWDRYETENSWSRNAMIVANTMGIAK
jgi:glycosyltransferase involved in cell wall biosynthesis